MNVFGFNVFTFSFFFLPEVDFTWDIDLPVGLVHYAQDPLALWTSTHWFEMALLVGPVHCSQNSQISLFNNFFIKNRSRSTIHTFKNYFVTVFSIFNF